ncbi:MAG: DUF1178 family protein [Pseudomonadota bacterium]
MIKYQLTCDSNHEFEGWFRNSDDFDIQSGEGLIDCPTCGSDAVRKAVMAPAIKRRSGSREARLAAIKNDIVKAAARARDYVEKNYDYVGDRFSDEARKIHYGEARERGIYGEATGSQVKELVTEGVQVAPLPDVKKKTDAAGDVKTRSVPSKKLN